MLKSITCTKLPGAWRIAVGESRRALGENEKLMIGSGEVGVFDVGLIECEKRELREFG